MNYKYQFTTEDEKQALITQNADKNIVEVQYLMEGNFIIFSDIPCPQSQMFTRLTNLENAVNQLLGL